MALTGLSPRQGLSLHSKCAQQTCIPSDRLAIGRRHKVRQQKESMRDRCNPCCDARPGASEPGRDPSLPPGVPRAKPAPSWNPFKNTKKEVSTCHSSCLCLCLNPRKVIVTLLYHHVLTFCVGRSKSSIAGHVQRQGRSLSSI